jgi:predicted nucleotidyltransferase
MVKPHTSIVSRQDVLRQVVQRIIEVIQPQRIVLFGSAAQNQMSEDSDLDVLVIVQGPAHRRALAQEIYTNLHGIPLPVDVVVATEQDVEQYGDRVGTILRPALREGQVIYEHNKQISDSEGFLSE